MCQVYKLLESEIILEDDYPVYQGSVYIFDMKIGKGLFDGTIGQYKKFYNVKEIRRCDIFDHYGEK